MKVDTAAKKSQKLHNAAAGLSGARSRFGAARRWRRALLLSICLHGVLFMVWLWSYSLPNNEVPPLVVELSSLPLRAASAGGLATELAAKAQPQTSSPQASKLPQASKSQTVKAQVAKAQSSAEVKERRAVKLLHSTQPRTHRAELPRTKTEASAAGVPQKELTLTRSTRYVNDVQPAAEPSGSSAAAPVPAGTAHTGVASKQGAKRTDGAAAGNAGQSALSQQRSSGGAAGDGRTSAMFNWANGTKTRELLAKTELPLPPALRYKGVIARVELSFNVDNRGRVYDINLSRSSGYPELDTWTMQTVRSFRFNSVNNKLSYRAEYIQYFKP